MTDPNAVAPEGLNHKVTTEEPFQVIVPAHLQDLKEGDLPENQRVAVLDQIAVFREAAARKEREKKALEGKEDRKPEQQRGVADYGYGNRAFHHSAPAPANGPHGQHTPGGRRDPQGYNEPVAFVRAQAAEAKVESTRTDEEEEELRLARKARERDHALRDVSHDRNVAID